LRPRDFVGGPVVALAGATVSSELGAAARERRAAVKQDIAYTLRLLRRAPAFAVAAVATLALGIGATTAMFTIVDAVLLRPLRFPDAERLVMLRPTSGSRLSAGYLDRWRRESRTFVDLAGWHDARATMTGRGEPVQILVDHDDEFLRRARYASAPRSHVHARPRPEPGRA
jgi:hypothetical protein